MSRRGRSEQVGQQREHMVIVVHHCGPSFVDIAAEASTAEEARLRPF